MPARFRQTLSVLRVPVGLSCASLILFVGLCCAIVLIAKYDPVYARHLALGWSLSYYVLLTAISVLFGILIAYSRFLLANILLSAVFIWFMANLLAEKWTYGVTTFTIVGPVHHTIGLVIFSTASIACAFTAGLLLAREITAVARWIWRKTGDSLRGALDRERRTRGIR
ncbi:hypothetical protein [Rhodobium gokarnense]|uniref:Membrane protein YjdF n=1 Tax=Rhodobium gokarnense TaxID=364296 RepID=A0ABT3H7U3_9HYPH|nr:hypothetical protein [Rhodobium gokarnense]MCW2306404.1 putative membrane protein YjdF [Rhodobium gokarnense]